jgi:hypothetical protein
MMRLAWRSPMVFAHRSVHFNSRFETPMTVSDIFKSLTALLVK